MDSRQLAPWQWRGAALASVVTLVAQLVAPAETLGPSQNWVIVPDQSSLPVPTPLNRFCRYGAAPAESLEKVRLPWLSVPCVPHWVPQNTMYTFSVPLVTPIPSMPPP